MEFDIKSIWRYRATLLLSTLAGLLFSIVYLAIGSTTYQAIARVLVEPQGTAKAGDSKPSVRAEPELLPTQAETIRSPALISEALKSVPIEPPRGTDPSKFDPVRHVLKSLSVTPVLRANVLTIAYRSSNAEEAIQVIKGLVDAHRRRIAIMDGDNIRSRLEVAQSTEALLREEKDKLTREYDQLRRQSPMLGKGREADAQLLNHLRQLGEELSVARKQKLEVETKVSLVSGIWGTKDEGSTIPATLISFSRGNVDSETSFDAIVNKYLTLVPSEEAYALRELGARLSQAQFAVREAKTAHGAQHPNVILAVNEEANCKKLVRERIESITSGWYQQLRLLQETERNLATEVEKEQHQVKSSEHFLLQEQHLLDEISKAERLHEPALRELLNLKAEQEGISSGRQSINVTIIDGPAIIDDMTWPQPKSLVACCSILGLAVGLCFAFLRETVLASPSRRAHRSTTDSIPQGFHSDSPCEEEESIGDWRFHRRSVVDQQIEVIA